MNRKATLLQAWDSAYGKEEWYPPFPDALNGVTAEQAAWKPEGGSVNSIWETARHLLYYKERSLRRLTGEEREYPEGATNDDTFTIGDATEEGWRNTISDLEKVHFDIRDRLAALAEERLDDKLPHTPIGKWAHNLLAHDGYHVGQIILLRKLQGSWPARRSFE